MPADLDELCASLLSRRPADRPSGTEVLARLGIAADDTTLTGGESSRAAFVGRHEELEALHAAYQTAAGGATVSVFVQGPSGMGKSALMRRFLVELDADPRHPIVLKGRCHERESLPYKAFDDVIDRLSHLLISLPADEVQGLLPDDADLLPRLFPVLRRVPGIQRAQALNISDPHEMRERAFAALGALLAKLARKKPLVVYIDDLQWADRDSLQLLVELFRSHSPPVMLFVGSLRSENLAGDEDGRLRTAMAAVAAGHPSRILDVGPLAPAEQRALVARLLSKGTTPADALGDDFWAQSSGSPLFLSEMARYAREHGALPAGERPSLEDVLYSRIERLPPTAFTLIEMVAIAGEPTPLWILGDACGLPADDRERALGILRVVNLSARGALRRRAVAGAVSRPRARDDAGARGRGTSSAACTARSPRCSSAGTRPPSTAWRATGSPPAIRSRPCSTSSRRRAAPPRSSPSIAPPSSTAWRSTPAPSPPRRAAISCARAARRSRSPAAATKPPSSIAAPPRAPSPISPPTSCAAPPTSCLRCGRLVEGMEAMREVMRSIGWRTPETPRRHHGVAGVAARAPRRCAASATSRASRAKCPPPSSAASTRSTPPPPRSA